MYENITYEVLLQRMLDRVSNKIDKREGSVIWDTHSPTALELQILYVELDTLIKNSFGDTAEREFLVRRGAERGITPYPASCATLKAVFTPNTIDLIGKRFNVDKLNYTVIEKIADGEYYVKCETEGVVGNQFFGTMVPIEYIAGLETAELVEVVIPGEDEEDTEDFRTRYFESFNDTAFGGNNKDYQNEVMGINGVGAVKVTRVWNDDIRPVEMIPSESVQTWYAACIDTLDGDVKLWLQKVYQAAFEKKLTVGGTIRLTIIDSNYNVASPVLVNLVQTTIDPEQNAGEGLGLAPIGHVVNVKSAEAVEVNISTTVTFSTGYSWDNSRSSIKKAIESYLLNLRKEWSSVDATVVRIAQIENHIMSVTGVVDAQKTCVNGKEENLTLGSYEIPVIGEVTND